MDKIKRSSFLQEMRRYLDDPLCAAPAPAELNALEAGEYDVHGKR